METYQVNGMAYGSVQSASPSGSPYTFTNNEAVRLQVSISAGTVTDISVSCDGITFNACGLLGGVYILNPGQSLKIVYLLAPTIKYWPV